MEQNLVSAALTSEDAAAIQKSLADAKAKLEFLLTLQGADIKGLVKVGNTFLPFIERAHQVATDHPEILPGVFNKEEFTRDCELIWKLRPIVSQINELANSIQNTYFATSSDAMTSALDVYAAVKQNRDKVPGLNVAAEDMATYFKRSTRKPNDN